MKTAYVDCISGASGNMLLGALLDAGLEPAALDAELAKLGVDDFRMEVRRVSKNGFGAVHVEVHAHDHAPERKLADLLGVIARSGLSESVKSRAGRVFTRICEVEAGIHGMDVGEVHLHEVGGVDAIVDVAGVLAGWELLGIERCIVSPLPLGRGFVRGAHGLIPLPAPATVGLLRGVPVTGSPVEGELVTPTGAALLTELADDWGALPSMTLESIGYGAGTRDFVIPNVLRLMIGDSAGGHGCGWTTETITVLETHLDRDTGEELGHAMQRLMQEGALDAIAIPGVMKKGRPAQVLKVLAHAEQADHLERVMFEETHTLGVRRSETRRDALPRDIEVLETHYGPISVKISRLPSGALRAAPEFADCEKAAARHGVPLPDVMHEVEHVAAHRWGLPHQHHSHSHEHPPHH
jgi:uncharacterized protein (TIGR00299 family) protein